MRLKNRNISGFTLIELLMVVSIICIIAFLVIVGIGVAMGNEWFTTQGVLDRIQLTDTNAVKVMAYERNIFKKSIITVKEKDGSLKKYSLDSDVLFNYKVAPIN